MVGECHQVSPIAASISEAALSMCAFKLTLAAMTWRQQREGAHILCSDFETRNIIRSGSFNQELNVLTCYLTSR
jgi:hypothetical protein